MTLAEIFVQLPPNVADTLVNLLETYQVPSEPEPDEILKGAQLVVEGVKIEHPNEQTHILELLDQVPVAVVEQLA